MIKEIVFEVCMVFIYALLGSTFIKGTIDRFLAGRYYLCGIDVFGAFYSMLLMAKFVLK